MNTNGKLLRRLTVREHKKRFERKRPEFTANSLSVNHRRPSLMNSRVISDSESNSENEEKKSKTDSFKSDEE